jgi:hypothetical protein
MNNRRPLTGLVLSLALLIPSLAFLAACKSPNTEEVKKSMEVVGLESKWVSREYRTWPHPKLVLVPAITFRIKNLSSAPLTYVNFNALFRESDATKFNGDCYLAAIRDKGVPPGELSDPITMTSNLGVEGTTLASFKDRKLWKPWKVRLFADTRGSSPVLLGDWDVSQVIDFKEDAPPPAKDVKK